MISWTRCIRLLKIKTQVYRPKKKGGGRKSKRKYRYTREEKSDGGT